MEKSNAPYAFLVKRQTFAPYKLKKGPAPEEYVYYFSRVLEKLCANLNQKNFQWPHQDQLENHTLHKVVHFKSI